MSSYHIASITLIVDCTALVRTEGADHFDQVVIQSDFSNESSHLAKLKLMEELVKINIISQRFSGGYSQLINDWQTSLFEQLSTDNKTDPP